MPTRSLSMLNYSSRDQTKTDVGAAVVHSSTSVELLKAIISWKPLIMTQHSIISEQDRAEGATKQAPAFTPFTIEMKEEEEDVCEL